MGTQESLIGLLASAILELPERNKESIEKCVTEGLGDLLKAPAQLTEANRLNDSAEVVLEKLLWTLRDPKGEGFLMRPGIDRMWSMLVSAREKQGRPKPLSE